jgi:hypothetical protein
MTTIISKVDATGLKVRMNNQVTVVYLYSDLEGDYFMNENLDKQYVKDTDVEVAEVVKVVKTEVKEKREKRTFEFEVEYEHNGRANGFAYTVSKVEAYDYDEALEKIKSRFNNIYDIAEY